MAIPAGDGGAWAPDYLTLTELKDFLRLNDVIDDALLQVYITAASRAVDRACGGRQFGKVEDPEPRTYPGRWFGEYRRYVFDIDDLATVTGSTLDVADLFPRNAVAKGKVWTQLRMNRSDVTWPSGDAQPSITITALWGWPAVPTAVKLATRLQASRFAARRESPFGVAGSPNDGSELRLLASVDPDVRVALDDYKRRWFAR